MQYGLLPDEALPRRKMMNASALTELTTKFGPMIMARQFTEASGRWPELRAELVALYDHDEPMEYLRILGGKCL